MDYRILGPLEVVDDGREVSLGGTKQRAVLACLLLRANQVVSNERLIDELWGDAPPPTAVKTIQVYVSRLRKELGDRVGTRPPGYILRVDPSELDLDRFEQLVGDARASGPAEAAEKLREALALWRGSPLAEFAYEPFAQPDIARLEELRLAALEERIDADLGCGRHAQVAGELESLVAEHPLRERLRAQLMLALYRSGRQAEALEAYRNARHTLLEELGLEPSPALQRLEQAILTQDESLEPPAPPEAAVARRAILVVPDARSMGELIALTGPLASSEPARELIVARVLETTERETLGEVTKDVCRKSDSLLGADVAARIAVFASPRPGEDIVRLASEQEVDLLVLAISLSALDDLSGGAVGNALRDSPCDVALLLRPEAAQPLDRPVLLPFGAAQHDWAALELGSWLARAHNAPLRLIGALTGGTDGRDASRLLADASIVVQRAMGVVAEPLLARPGAEDLLIAAEDAGILVIGLSDRWSKEGLGEVRQAIAETARLPILFVRRGLRPGGLAPAETRTRFTWSLGVAAG